MKKNSRQREAILNVLRATDTHPTAVWVYERVRESIPNISLGTVYRNLHSLCGSGEILALSVGDGYEHYDGNCVPHIHLHCRCCGKITDAAMGDNPFPEIAGNYQFIPEAAVCILYGVCRDCSAEEK